MGYSSDAVKVLSKAAWASSSILFEPNGARVELEQASRNAIAGGSKVVFGAVGEASTAVAKAIGNVVNPIVGGLKWAVIIGVGLLALWFLTPVLVAKAASR